MIIVGHFVVDFFTAMKNGGVVTSTKGIANLEERGTCLLTHDVHGNLARPGNFAVALFAFEAFKVDVIVLANTFQNPRDGQYRAHFALRCIKVLQGLGRQTDRERGIVQGGIGNYTIERTFYFTHTTTLGTSDILDYRGRNGETHWICFGA